MCFEIYWILVASIRNMGRKNFLLLRKEQFNALTLVNGFTTLTVTEHTRREKRAYTWREKIARYLKKRKKEGESSNGLCPPNGIEIKKLRLISYF